MFAVFENLQVFESRYEELNLKLYDPATAADRELYARLMKEHKEIEPIVETYRAWRQCGADLSGAKELLEEAADRELKEMAQQEIREKGIELSRLEEELKLLLLPKDPNDEKNVIVEIRGGAGGEEAALFAYNLYRMYTAYAEGKGWKTEIVSLNETELGGFKEVSFLIVGEGAYSRLKYESGVHRVQRVPETEAGGRIHTSTVTVAVLPYSAGLRPLPDADFLAKVQAQLESIRPICTRVKAVAPLYIRIHISVTVLTRAGAQDVEAGIRRAVQACFASDENGWRLGDRITEGEIAGAIGQVRGVLGVKTLLMTAESARAGRTEAGDIVLPPHALPELGALEVYR